MNTFEPMSNTIGVRYGDKMAWVSFGGTESGGAVTYNGPKAQKFSSVTGPS